MSINMLNMLTPFCIGSTSWPRIAALLAVGALSGCASAPPAPQEAPPAGRQQDSAAVDSKSRPEEQAPSSDKAVQPPPTASGPVPRLAADSVAKGVEPLSKEEEDELQKNCKTYTDTVKKRARDRSKDARTPSEAALGVINEDQSAEKSKANLRCHSLLRRGLIAAIALTREGEAITALRRMVFGMSDHYNTNKRLCPSTERVPLDISAMKGRAYEARRENYATPAWKCLRFDTLGTPQHYQYWVEVNEPRQSFRASARGFSVDGDAEEHLYVELKVQDGSLAPSGDVMRK